MASIPPAALAAIMILGHSEMRMRAAGPVAKQKAKREGREIPETERRLYSDAVTALSRVVLGVYEARP